MPGSGEMLRFESEFAMKLALRKELGEVNNGMTVM